MLFAVESIFNRIEAKPMNVKQQKQIRAFLINEFGREEGSALSDKQEKMLVALIKNTRNKTENQIRTLTRTILPCIALYKVLADEVLAEEKVHEYMRKYMIDVVAAKMHTSMAKMEIVPGFYFIYSKMFLKIMRTTNLHVSTQKCGKDYYDITITKCLWNTACAENGCVELCRLFCDADDNLRQTEKDQLYANKNVGLRQRLLRLSFLQKIESWYEV